MDSSPRKVQVEGGVDRHATIKVLSISEACKLSPTSLVSMMVKITTVNPPEELLRSDKQSHVTKQDCIIADATGSCRLVLWASRVGAVTEGQSYHLKSVAVRQYKNQKYMSTLEHTTDFEKISDIGAVNHRCITTERKIKGEISRVLSFEHYLAVQSATQKCNKLTPSVVNVPNAVELSSCPNALETDETTT